MIVTCFKYYFLSCLIIKDDMQEIFDAILKSDKIILSAPICSWLCSAPVLSCLV